ncbi:FHA domain-containing protein, partial [Streptomyces pinistramenti]|uniref:FHA domain-containing protein n=1 Tax=Streptomyces pinistramenti TaxID=2884812 RepID=UPI001D07FA68
MQIRLTVLGPRSGHPTRACDVLVTAPAGTALAAVAGSLAASVAGSGADVGASGGGPVVLFAGSERLDPQRAALGEPPLIDGAVLSLQAPGPDPAHGLPHGPARLRVVSGPDAGGVHLLHGGQIHIGRSADADVPLDDPDVSRLHCAVTVEADGSVYVADLRSTNGTVVDGAELAAHPAPLHAGTLLRIGESALRLQPSSGTPDPALQATPDGEGHLRVRPGDTGTPDADGGAGEEREPGRGGAAGAGGPYGGSYDASGVRGAASGPSGGAAPAETPGRQGEGSEPRGVPGLRHPQAARGPATPSAPYAQGPAGTAYAPGAAPDPYGPGAREAGALPSGSGDGARPGAYDAHGAARDPRAPYPGGGLSSAVASSAARGQERQDTPLHGTPISARGQQHPGSAPPPADDAPAHRRPEYPGHPGSGSPYGGHDPHDGRFASAHGTPGDPRAQESSRQGTPLRGTTPEGFGPGVRERSDAGPAGAGDGTHGGQQELAPPAGMSRKGGRRGGIGAWARRLAGGRPAVDGPEEAAAPQARPAAAAADTGHPADEAAQDAAPPSGPAALERWPDAAAVLLTALGPGPRLWERDQDHPDALAVRLGTASRAGGRAAVPVAVELRRAGARGLAGPRARLAGLARSALAQLAALHS